MDAHGCAPPQYAAAAAGLPAYTPHESDQCVSNVGVSSTTGPIQEYEYKNGSLKLNLGPKRDGLFRPAYGWNASVEGYLQVKKVTNVQSILISLEGNVTTGVSERGFITELNKTQVLHVSQTLFDASSGELFPVGGARYQFSIPLPSYVRGGTQPLPPTFTAAHPGVTADVTYFIKIEMMRKGRLRQNERLKAFFFYLPRTYARLPQSMPDIDKSEESCEWHVASVLPKLPKGAAPTSASELCVSVAFPRPLEYAAGSAIPFHLTVVSNCRALPLLFSGLSVQLVRVTVLRVGDRQSSREIVVGGGEVFRVEERGDVRMMFGSVRCGKQGESSWNVGGVGVKYIVRVRLGPREDAPSLTGSLPTYMHEQVVTVRTREYALELDNEREPEPFSAPRLPVIF